MLEDLVKMHLEVMKKIPQKITRYCYPTMNWKSKGICILGDRGTGKTTMMCQYFLETYKTPNKGLYISADHIHVISYGLFNIARDYFAEGGEALFIDEVHKYPEWSTEIKNILDVYKDKQIIFSASSSVDLKKSKGDLSRRVVYYRLVGLSFREYLHLSKGLEYPTFTLSEIITGHTELAQQFSPLPLLQYFKEYLEHGYYPFFLEGIEDYLSKLSNVIEKVLFEDIAVVYHLKQTSLPVLKKLLWLIATSKGLSPNIDNISKNLRISREMVYNSLEYLNHSGLIHHLYPLAKGMKLVRKPGKIYLNNTNLDHVIHGSLKLSVDAGGLRETFFVNQVGAFHKVDLHDKGDFLIDEKIAIEVGGRGKTTKQTKGIDQAYLAVDQTEIGFGKKIPLYLFGFLY